LSGSSYFDNYAADYDAVVNSALRMSGETREYFTAGRVEFLLRWLRSRGLGERVQRIADLGCGDGGGTRALARRLPAAEVVGLDASETMLREARRRGCPPGVRFASLEIDAAWPASEFDLVHAANVLHHVDPSERPNLLGRVSAALRPGGILAVFENNPWNPGTRAVMARVPFDDGAWPLSILRAAALARSAGLSPISQRSLFYFPRCLAWLRPLEDFLSRLPLGAQYVLLAERPVQ
jgi:trans-aconitate methyltransferase